MNAPKGPRRAGAKGSKTRDVILGSTERLMVDEGYAAVTYRRVAAAAGVTAPLVQYYFPTIDSLFLALLHQHAEPNLARLIEKLEAVERNPLRVIWEYSADETSSALMVEFMALGNHRKEIRSEIAEVTRRSRKTQLDALSRLDLPSFFAEQDPPTPALLFLLAAVPKILLMESAMDVSMGHSEILHAVEHYLDRVEPLSRTTRRGQTDSAVHRTSGSTRTKKRPASGTSKSRPSRDSGNTRPLNRGTSGSAREH
jgi:AcrR family transcriptional regulator